MDRTGSLAFGYDQLALSNKHKLLRCSKYGCFIVAVSLKTSTECKSAGVGPYSATFLSTSKQMISTRKLHCFAVRRVFYCLANLILLDRTIALLVLAQDSQVHWLMWLRWFSISDKVRTLQSFRESTRCLTSCPCVEQCASLHYSFVALSP